MNVQDVTVIILDILMAVAFIFYTLVFPAKLERDKKSQQGEEK